MLAGLMLTIFQGYYLSYFSRSSDAAYCESLLESYIASAA